MAIYRATATVGFTFSFEGSPGQARRRAEEVVESLICEADEENITFVVGVERLETEPHVVKLREYPPDKVFSFVPDDHTGEHRRRIFTVNRAKYSVKMTSDRLRLFKKNPKCVSCGLEGTRMFLERQGFENETGELHAHFNLYGVEDGKLILMTKDHIKPKAFGGADDLSNLQTMCSLCNGLKSSFSLDLEGVAQLRAIYRKKGHVSKGELKKSLQQTRLLYLTELNGQ